MVFGGSNVQDIVMPYLGSANSLEVD